MFNKIIARIVARKANKYSATVSVLKGAEPTAYIGGISTVVFMLCKYLQIDITEETIAAITAGATALYGVIKAFANYAKNKNK